ncbi:type II secretion system protein [Thiomicrospira sp.]|uniref:type II secretion system protein n=1 Tax=Thiomicrospira sp. TaxID=935 RepID=UPI002F9426A9
MKPLCQNKNTEQAVKGKDTELNKKLEKQKGFTIVELMIAVVIVGVLVAGVMKGVPALQNAIKTNGLKNAIMDVSNAITGLGAGGGNYGTSSLDEYIIRVEKVPSSITVTGTSPNRELNHALGGTLETMGRGNNYVITLNNIPGNICIELFNGASSNRINVSSSDPSSVPVDSGGLTPPYETSDILAACAEDTPNRMHFIY